MFISFQNFLAFQITYYSVCIKFLLHEGMEYLLIERFPQNVLEQYFGNYRKIGSRNNNPDLKEFRFSDNALKIQRNISITSENIRGQYDSKPCR